MDKTNKEKFAEIKKFIRTEFESRVEILRQAMENAIAGISRLEDTFDLADRQSTKGIPIQTQPPSALLNRVNRRPAIRGKKKKTAGQRMDVALAGIPEKFTRKELKDKINSDGKKSIKDGTFGSEFAKRLNRGKIFVQQESVGNKPGIYSKLKDAGQA